MGAVYEEFERELARLRTQFADDPRREIIRLFLLALEREELVSVGYRESLIERRLASMPIPDDVREVIRHALVWIWKDEEMQGGGRHPRLPLPLPLELQCPCRYSPSLG